ncbi:hypothetical protein PG990_008112 [Apiospora arundinis]
MSSRVWEQIRDSLDPKDTIIAFYRYLTKGFQQRIAFVPPAISKEAVDQHRFEHVPLPAHSENFSIRLLELLPSSQADADVQCRITHHRLVDCEGDYETLSYVWGDIKEPVPLTIGDDFLSHLPEPVPSPGGSAT